MQTLTTAYLAQLLAIQQTGAAQPEQSYYPALQIFLQNAAERLQHGAVQAVLQPQHQDYGVPDFQVQQGHTIVGWAEAKALGGALYHNTNQIRQYRALHNLLFTNFLRFRLFVNGQEYGEVTLADAPDAVPTSAAVAGISELLNVFFQQSVPAIQSAGQLAHALALRARFLRQAVIDAMELAPVQALHNAYTQYLFPDIGGDDFADLVAQTIVYTLFAAWSQTQFGQLTLLNAAAQLPPNIPLLLTLFNLTANNAALTHTAIGLHVTGVVNLLAATNPDILLIGAGEDVQEDVGHDPVMYFYQPFLHAYSPRTAEARGVYYTPIPAVRAMVKIADAIATNVYGRELGLAGENVFLLDPATGTGTFLVEAGQRIVANVTAAGDAGLLPQYLQQRFVTNSCGFEFLAAPYTIAHLKLARFLYHDCGLANIQRLRVYLTNTLHTPEFIAPALPFLEALAEENQAATAIKTDQPLLVIIGNPPWSGHSENLDVHLNGMDVVEPFKWCDGERVAQTKWLNNDYVKFLRWSQWRITENPHQEHHEEPTGVVILITDNSYLTSPTFRGMRRYLLTQFDRIHIIDLHGNIRSGAAGVADQNIFEIIQGVTIGVFIRGGTLPSVTAPDAALENAEGNADSPFLTIALPESATATDDADMEALSTALIRATVTYTSSGAGTRAEKYHWLDALTWDAVQQSPSLSVAAPFYFFKPFELNAEYFSWPGSMTTCRSVACV